MECITIEFLPIEFSKINLYKETSKLEKEISQWSPLSYYKSKILKCLMLTTSGNSFFAKFLFILQLTHKSKMME